MADITLHYLDLYGRGETTRLVFIHNDVQFVDHRFPYSEIDEFKKTGLAEFGQVPVLEIDGLVLVQSRSILRYVSQKYGHYPDNIADIYWVESLGDLKEDYYNLAISVIWPNDEEGIQRVYSKHVPVWLQTIESRLIRNNNGDGWFVGNSVTRADFEMFEFIWDFVYKPDKIQKFGFLLGIAPKLEAFIQRFLEFSPRIKNYLDSRPERFV